jgi:putative membrane protein
VALAALAITGISPKDGATWWMEVAPVLIAAPILVFTYRRFPFTALVYALLAVHAVILCTGGHYTYAEVPLGFWMRDAFGFARNHYDRIGHLAQGFVPALVAREVLLRTTPLRRGKMLFFLVTCVCLAASAAYELVEWAASVSLGQSADAFLGTQGDPWDTQWDMLMALVGALGAQLLLGAWHDRQLRTRENPRTSSPLPT